MRRPLDPAALDVLFKEARTHSSFTALPVDDAILATVWNLARMGPTSANSSPGRIVFVKSVEAKKLLEPALSSGNRAKTMKAPTTAIFAYDMQFYDLLPRLFPQDDARSWFAGNDEAIRVTAFRNGTLQAAYFIIAARALGLDCGPMSGFDNAKVDAAFFPDGRYRSNFICNLGYGDGQRIGPRNSRLEFDEACKIL